MGKRFEERKSGGRSVISWVAVFALLFSMMSSAFAQPVAAKSSRAAIVTEVTGDVTYKKSGGSKVNTVYRDLTLNQGDYISVGPSSSVVLKIVDHEDEVTIDENSELYISDLLDEGKGKVTKMKAWAGSLWSKVKSLVSSEDSFEVETPTAVMGVRGTNFWQSVDPVTGRTALVVASGIVRATTVTAAKNEAIRQSLQESKYVNVYPAQQIVLDSRSQAADLKTKVEVINVGDLVNNTSPKVIEKIIRGAADIQQENAMLRERLLNDLNNGIQEPVENSNLQIRDLTDLNEVTSNFDNIVANIAKQAVDAKKIEKAQMDKIIHEANQTITDPAKIIDLNQIQAIDPTAGLDPGVEKAKQAAVEAKARYAEEQRQLIEHQQRLAALLAKIEEDKKRIDEANKAAAREAVEKAVEQLKAQLDDAARKAFEESQKKNEEAKKASSAPGTNTPGGSSSSPSSPSRNSRPPSPSLISPTEATVSGNPVVVRLTAPSSTTVELLNTEQVVLGSAQGKDSEEVAISLTLPEGVHSLTARTVRGSSVSVPVALPPITVVVPSVPELISPKTDTAFDSGQIKVIAKAPAGHKLLLLSGSQVLASAESKGDTPVEFALADNSYTGLTLVSEKSGIRSAAVAVPALSNKPAVTLSQIGGVQPDGMVKFSLEMRNFTSAKPFYAIEAHMVYNSNELDYSAPNSELSDVPGTVFDGNQTAETLRQVKGSGQSELIYAATQFDTASASVDNIKLNGSKPLVSFSLKKQGTSAGIPAVQLVYVKLVDKNGNVVYELPATGTAASNSAGG